MLPCHHVVDLEGCELEGVFEVVHGSEGIAKGLIGQWSRVVLVGVRKERAVSVEGPVSEVRRAG